MRNTAPIDNVMDYAKQLYAQLRDLFLSMTPGNRIIASLLATVLVVSLGYLVVGSIKTDATLEGKYTYLYGDRDFDQDEKAAAENVFAKQGLRSHEWVGDQLRVSQSLKAKYAAALAEGNALRSRNGFRLNTAKNIGPWESGKAWDKKMEQAYAMDAADAIAEMTDIASAKVIPSLRREFDRKVLQWKLIPSVAVTVKTKTFKPLSDEAVAAIASIVIPSFSIVDMKEVRITDITNTRSYDGSGRDIAGSGTSYMKEQARYQEQFKDRIYSLFPMIRGLQVETSVELTQKIYHNVFQVRHDDPTAVHTHVRGTDFEKTDADRFGRPGQIAQMSRPLIDPTAGIDMRAKTKEITHENETSNALQGEESRFEMIPFVPQKVVASLQVPRSYIRENWLKKNKTSAEPTEEQLDAESTLVLDSMKKQVEHLLRLYRDPKNPDCVDIMEYQDDPVEEVVLTAWEQFQLWLFENWQTLGLMGLVLAGLGVLWLITRPTTPEPIVIYEAPEVPLELLEARAKAEEEAAAQAATEAEAEVPQRTLESFKSMLSLQEEIAELIAENPDAAAAVLRQWIGTVVLAER